jgi:hypothetical protein
MAGLHASLHVMLAYAEHIGLHVDRSDNGSTFAVISTDDGRITISGPAEQVASMLRKLADKVDAEHRAGQAVA